MSTIIVWVTEWVKKLRGLKIEEKHINLKKRWKNKGNKVPIDD